MPISPYRQLKLRDNFGILPTWSFGIKRTKAKIFVISPTMTILIGISKL